VTHWRVYAARLFPGLVFAQAVHRFEEFVSGSYAFFPYLSLPAEMYLAASVAWLLLLLALIPSVAHRRRWAIWLGWIVALLELGNGADPLAYVLVTRIYAPGAWTAPLVFGFALAYSVTAFLAARKAAAVQESVHPLPETHTG
jgi:hypothetical protein